MALLNQKPMEHYVPETPVAGTPWRLFTYAGLAFLASLLIYLGLSMGYSAYLSSRITAVEQQLKQLGTSISKEDQDKFVRFYSQLVNFNKLLDNHILSADTFSLLEKNTNQKVRYTNFDLKIDERKLTLDGSALSYEILAQQLASFAADPGVENYMLNQSQMSDGSVKFKAVLILKKEVLK
ncbi:MAG: hypothetical protein Q8P76_04025 [bacterium]|nr:hypothetical protein [bacterium]